jgi:guanylate kinase
MLAAFGGEVERVVTATSRPPRKGEVDGRDYIFLSPEEFERRVQAGDFYEHARVHANRYGVLRSAVLDRLDASVDLLLNIDVQGAATFRAAATADERLRGRVASVFIMPRDVDQLRERLSGRGSDDAAEIALRMDTALTEMRQWQLYDYCIESADRETDFDRVRAIYLAESLRVQRLLQFQDSREM